MFIKPGKLNLVIDGQFGSTGKGTICSYIGYNEHIDVAISNSSPNAGHSFYFPDQLEKKITRHLPVSALFNKHSVIYLCANSIINPKILLKEIKDFDIDEDRICIHPRAAVIEDEDIKFERDFNSSVSKIASTREGVGSALSRKILRSAKLAQDNKYLKKYVNEIDIHDYLDNDLSIIMETSQGFDLSINSGISYPYCTSREVTVSSALSDCQVHPKYLGNVMMSIRTFPIRVGNIVEDGKTIGESGPFYPDSVEVNWNKFKFLEEPEHTTVTKRVRRIATFSMIQYKRSVDRLKPTHVFLNFINYINSKRKINSLLKELGKYKEVTHIGTGPLIQQVLEI